MKKLRVIANLENNEISNYIVVEELLLEHEYALDSSSVITTNDDTITVGDIISNDGSLIQKNEIVDPTPETPLTKEDIINVLLSKKQSFLDVIEDYVQFNLVLQERCDLANSSSWPIQFTEKEIAAGANSLTKEKYIDRKMKIIEKHNLEIERLQTEIDEIDSQINQLNVM